MSGRRPIGCTCLAISGCLLAKVRTLSGRSRDELMFWDLCRSVIHCRSRQKKANKIFEHKNLLCWWRESQCIKSYRSRSWFWDFSCVLPPFWVLHLHVWPFKNFLHIWEGILADSRCFDILPERQSPIPQRHVQGTLSGLMIQSREKKEVTAGLNFRHITDHQASVTGEKLTSWLSVLWELWRSWCFFFLFTWAYRRDVTDRCVILPLYLL